MKVKQDIIRETVIYEQDSLFLLHNNIYAEDYPNHWHNAIEIIMPVKDGYKVDVNYKPYMLRENDILIVPSGELHHLSALSLNGQRLILQFSIEILNSVRSFIKASYVYAKPRLITPENEPELYKAAKSLLLEMLSEHLARNIFFEIAVTQKIIALTVHLARGKHEDGDAQYDDLSKHKMNIERLNTCIDFINRNSGEPLTLEAVAQAVGFSKYHFSRWFQELANVTFHDYLSRIRIDKATVMLLNSRRSITDIAMEAGFQNANTFNRIFRKYKNCTPSEFRRLSYLKQQPGGKNNMQAEEKRHFYIAKTPVPAGIPGSGMPDTVNYAGTEGMPYNPLIWADIPDPDVITAGDVYYMVSTTMYFNPGIPVMKSTDLVHWEIVNYVYDILDDSDECALRNGAYMYGKGSWAASLRYHNETFYVAVASLNTKKTYIFQAKDIENGPWQRFEIQGIYHDPSLLFDDDGRVYLVYSSGTIRAVELTAAADALLPGGLDCVIIENANAGGDGGLPAEGSHIYKINGMYYLFLIAWPPGKRRIELCYRADRFEGPYEGRVVLDDDIGYNNCGVAQGGLVETPGGEWYAMLFQDHGAAGRVPVLVSVTWEDGWPVLRADGKVTDNSSAEGGGLSGAIVTSDEFFMQYGYKEYGAANGTDYRGAGAAALNENPDEQLLVNCGFEDAATGWTVMENAHIEITGGGIPGKSPLLHVTKRVTTASGPRQIITGKVRPGGVYESYARVKYISGPGTKTFNICIRNGTSWEGTRIIGTGTLKKGEWGSLRGTYTIPDDADMTESSVFIETPWKETLSGEDDLMDFYVEYVSLVAKNMPVRNKTIPGENDPRGMGLAPAWQWNHNPDHNLWSLTERPGYLRLRSAYLSRGLLDARNTLTQRTFGPVCAGVTALETGGMKDGDTAGLAALQEFYGFAGVKMTHGRKYIVMQCASPENGHKEEFHPHMLSGVSEYIPLEQQRVYLRADFDFDGSDMAYFFYSLDELQWHKIGEPVQMQYTLSHFTGYRFALFYYSAQLTGGYADFDYFRTSSRLMQNEDNLTVLKAMISGDTLVPGMPGAEIKVSVHLDALPDGGAVTGDIYLSMPVPDMLDVKDIIPCFENITGSTEHSVTGRQLLLTVRNGASFANKISDKLTDIIFSVNSRIDKDIMLTLRPDYIYVDDERIAYNTHEACVQVNVFAMSENNKGYSSINAACIKDGDTFTAADADFGDKEDELLFYAAASVPAGGWIEVRVDNPDGETAGVIRHDTSPEGWIAGLSKITGIHTVYFTYRGEDAAPFRLGYRIIKHQEKI